MSTQEKNPSRSRRAARACARCHSRKVRCDGSITGFPCTNCRLDEKQCTLHSGKRERERQLLRAISSPYPTPATTPGHHRRGSSATLTKPASIVRSPSQVQPQRPAQKVLDVFISHYFLYVHPCLPVVDEAAFWRRFRCSDGSAGSRIPTLLFQAMLFAASSFVPLDAAKQCGYSSLIAARDDLYLRAKRIYESGIEKDRLVIAQSALLLTHYTTDAERSTNSRWLRIAIRHAKKERAHLYPTAPSLADNGRRKSDLKRLWWSCLIRDRIISLGMRRPIQIAPDDFDLQQPGLSFEDLEEECLHSEVYTPETKIALCRLLSSLCHLVVAVTDLAMIVYPVAQGTPLNRAELDRLEEIKIALLDWELTWVAYPDGKEYYIHPSLTLYTNLIAIYYQSARIALCNRICLVIGSTSSASFVYLEDNADLTRIESCRAELASAIRSTADNVKQLILNGVADKLPISAVAYTLLPQILLSIQTALSPTPEDKQLHEVMLVFFVEIFRCFRAQYYVGLILALAARALELCRPVTGSTSTSTFLFSEDSSSTGTTSPGTSPAVSKAEINGEDTDNNPSSYPSLFQLRLTEYIRLLRYVDEFMSLRRVPGVGEGEGEGGPYLPGTATATGTDMFPYTYAYAYASHPISINHETEKKEKQPIPVWMESMESFFFGNGEEFWSASSSSSSSSSSGSGYSPVVEVDGCRGEIDSGSGVVGEDVRVKGAFGEGEEEGEGGRGICKYGETGVDGAEELVSVSVSRSESFRDMFECLPLLGE